MFYKIVLAYIKTGKKLRPGTVMEIARIIKKRVVTLVSRYEHDICKMCTFFIHKIYIPTCILRVYVCNTFELI